MPLVPHLMEGLHCYNRINARVFGGPIPSKIAGHKLNHRREGPEMLLCKSMHGIREVECNIAPNVRVLQDRLGKVTRAGPKLKQIERLPKLVVQSVHESRKECGPPWPPHQRVLYPLAGVSGIPEINRARNIFAKIGPRHARIFRRGIAL